MITAVALLLFARSNMVAQPGTAEVRGTIGYTTFLDEAPQHHLLTGGSVRIYVTRRLSVEPEFLFLYRSERDKDIIAWPQIAYDFADPGSRVIPYVIGGVGLMHSIFPRFSTTESAVSGGFGMKVFVNDRVFVAPEARLGFEPILRFSVSVGYAFGAKR